MTRLKRQVSNISFGPLQTNKHKYFCYWVNGVRPCLLLLPPNMVYKYKYSLLCDHCNCCYWVNGGRRKNPIFAQGTDSNSPSLPLTFSCTLLCVQHKDSSVLTPQLDWIVQVMSKEGLLPSPEEELKRRYVVDQLQQVYSSLSKNYKCCSFYRFHHCCYQSLVCSFCVDCDFVGKEGGLAASHG